MNTTNFFGFGNFRIFQSQLQRQLGARGKEAGTRAGEGKLPRPGAARGIVASSLGGVSSRPAHFFTCPPLKMQFSLRKCIFKCKFARIMKDSFSAVSKPIFGSKISPLLQLPAARSRTSQSAVFSARMSFPYECRQIVEGSFSAVSKLQPRRP